MNNRYKGGLLLLLLFISMEGISQGSSFLWKLESLNEEARKQKEQFRNISRTGFQLDQKALGEGELVLTFNYLPAVGKPLKRKADKIVVSSGAGQLANSVRFVPLISVC